MTLFQEQISIKSKQKSFHPLIIDNKFDSSNISVCIYIFVSLICCYDKLSLNQTMQMRTNSCLMHTVKADNNLLFPDKLNNIKESHRKFIQSVKIVVGGPKMSLSRGFQVYNKIKVHKNVGIRFLSKIRVSFDHRFATIESEEIGSNDHFKYPLIWLRDNCQCVECFHKNSSSRIINWANFNFEKAIFFFYFR